MEDTKNPQLIELTKSWRERSVSLSDLNAYECDGIRYCLWCATKALPKRNQKYCSQTCSVSAMAWAYPQGIESIGVLLIKQDWKCATCAFDYAPLAVTTVSLRRRRVLGFDPTDFKDKFSYWVVKWLKGYLASQHDEHRIEVDHIEPIYKGGSPLERKNLQILCRACHKAKSKIDNSGPRKPTIKTKRKSKLELQEENEKLKDENENLRDLNDTLLTHLDALSGKEPWDL